MKEKKIIIILICVIIVIISIFAFYSNNMGEILDETKTKYAIYEANFLNINIRN